MENDKYSGITVNERLYVSGLLDEFDKAVEGKNTSKVIDILHKVVSKDASGWLKLYQDPEDGRYWQLTYKHGEMQGGGPTTLVNISEREAKDQYNI